MGRVNTLPPPGSVPWSFALAEIFNIEGGCYAKAIGYDSTFGFVPVGGSRGPHTSLAHLQVTFASRYLAKRLIKDLHMTPRPFGFCFDIEQVEGQTTWQRR